MNRNSNILLWGLRVLALITLLSFFICTDLQGQTTQPKKIEVTDSNFKKVISKDFVLVVFTAKWSSKKSIEDVKKISNGVKGYKDIIIIETDSKGLKKVTKKLRIRNFPSIALFYKGEKKKVWKGDMDGILDVTSKDIKKEIEEILSGDVF